LRWIPVVETGHYQERDWSGRLVGIVPVVSCADTLLVVTGFDYRDPAEDHSADRILNIDGFDVKPELTLDTDRCGLMFLADTIGTAARFGGALTMIAGSRDTWVEADQARLVAQAATSCDLLVLDEIGHDFGRSVRRARFMFQTAA